MYQRIKKGKTHKMLQNNRTSIKYIKLCDQFQTLYMRDLVKINLNQ